MHRIRATRWAALLVVGAVLPALAEDFERPMPEPLPAALPAALRAGDGFRVVEPVEGDGLMRHYRLDTRYGTFDAFGAEAIPERIHEVAALATLEHTTGLGVVVDAVGDRVGDSARQVVAVATHPIDTVAGLPRGISHLFKGYVAEARDLAERAGHETSAPDAPGGASAPTIDAKRYVARYFGVSGSERGWYRKLGVDPYTDNEPLRRTVARLARVDATAKFGLKFAPLPGIPYAGELGRAMDAIYNEHPAVLKARRRARLEGYGLTRDEIQGFEHTLALNPTRQQLIDAAAERLEGVEGRAELYRHAIGLKSEAEATVYVRSALRLAARHAETPLATLLPGLRMPSARRRDGALVVVAAFDAVRWTEQVEAAEREVRAALPDPAPARELWLAAAPSARAAGELAARGWQVKVDDAQAAAGR